MSKTINKVNPSEINKKQKELENDYNFDCENMLFEKINSIFNSNCGDLEEKRLIVLESQDILINNIADSILKIKSTKTYENDDIRLFDDELSTHFNNQGYLGNRINNNAIKEGFKYDFKTKNEVILDLKDIFFKVYKQVLEKHKEIGNLREYKEEKETINILYNELENAYKMSVNKGYYSKDILDCLQRSNVRLEIVETIQQDYGLKEEIIDKYYLKALKQLKERYSKDTTNIPKKETIHIPAITKFAIGLKVFRKTFNI